MYRECYATAKLILSIRLFLDGNTAFKYSRTSLSRTRLFRITAYLEVKIWSLF